MTLENKRCIAVVGGGGKTSLLFWLAEQLVQEGKRVILSTTTHMGYDSKRPFAAWNDFQKIRENIEVFGYSVTGLLPENHAFAETVKISCPDDARWDRLLALCDVLLLEADGARRLPVKVPAPHEPVIPDEADLVIGVVGLDCLDKKICDICHRPQLAAALLGKPETAVLTEEDVAAICTSEHGLKKNVMRRDFLVVLNKADTAVVRARAERIKTMIKGERTMVTALQRKKISIILLAAGDSRRFGKENKLLYEIDGKPMFWHCLEKMAALECRDITVVTQFDEIADIARSMGAKVLYNPHPQEGISSSVKIGLKANIDAQAWMFSVCDQPRLRMETLEELIACYFSSGKGIAALSCKGKIGNPCIFSPKYKEELLELTGDVGGKHVIVNHRDDTAVCLVKDEWELEDIDYRV